MNSKSIDGLKRRDSSNRLGFPEKHDKKIARRPEVRSMVTPAKRQVTAKSEKTKLDEHDVAIRNFLSSVQDDDPTNLVSELPEKEEKVKQKKSKKPNKPKGKRALKIISRTLGVLLIVAIAAAAWAYIQGNGLVSRVTGGSLWNVLFADPDTPLATDPITGRTNILIFGTEGYSMDDSSHPGSQLTDTVMVASLDQDSGDIRTISLPRDLKMNRTCTATAKLNEVYYCTYSKNNKTAESKVEYEKLAAQELANQTREILGIEIQYFVHANWQALVQIVDALDGIDVAFVYKGTNWAGDEVAIETLDKRGLRDYWDPKKQNWLIDYKNGEVAHLDGEHALGVARSRNAYGGYGSNDNFGREQFQQKIIQAVIMKAKKTNFATDFMAALSIKNAVGDNLRMDFKDTELKSLFKLVGRIDMDGLRTVSLQSTEDDAKLLTSGSLQASNGEYYSYVYPAAGVGNYANIHAYVARKLSSDAMVSENAKIVVMNATSAQGVASGEGTRLKDKGYNVTQNANAPSALGAVEGVKVYQLNKQMSGTAKALKELYGDVVLTSIPDALTNHTADFIVVLGNGYASSGS